jgi:hypothetical protein
VADAGFKAATEAEPWRIGRDRNFIARPPDRINYPLSKELPSAQMDDRAVRIAKAEHCVIALIFPNGLQDEPYAEPPRKHGTLRSGVGYTDPKIVPY